MLKNKPNNRRSMVIMAVMAAIALVGVTMIKVEPARADRTLASVTGVAATDGGAATADNPTSAPSPGPASERPGIGSAVAKMISALALVLVAVYGGLYLLRRMMGKRRGGIHGLSALEVLETTYVGQHKAISLVKVGKRAVLVGVTDNQISTLTELDQDETEEILGQTPEPVKSEGFATLLSGAAEKLKTFGLKKKQAALETQMPATF